MLRIALHLMINRGGKKRNENVWRSENQACSSLGVEYNRKSKQLSVSFSQYQLSRKFCDTDAEQSTSMTTDGCYAMSSQDASDQGEASHKSDSVIEPAS